MLKFLKTCKSKGCLKTLLMILEKCLFMSRRRLGCLNLFSYKGIRLRKIKARVKSHDYQIKEKTILDDLTNNHKVCFMMHSALKVMNTRLWYIDSGCSRHMTGDHTLFKEFESKKGGNVTFGDGSKSQIKDREPSLYQDYQILQICYMWKG